MSRWCPTLWAPLWQDLHCRTLSQAAPTSFSHPLESLSLLLPPSPSGSLLFLLLLWASLPPFTTAIGFLPPLIAAMVSCVSLSAAVTSYTHPLAASSLLSLLPLLLPLLSFLFWVSLGLVRVLRVTQNLVGSNGFSQVLDIAILIQELARFHG